MPSHEPAPKHLPWKGLGKLHSVKGGAEEIEEVTRKHVIEGGQAAEEETNRPIPLKKRKRTENEAAREGWRVGAVAEVEAQISGWQKKIKTIEGRLKETNIGKRALRLRQTGTETEDDMRQRAIRERDELEQEEIDLRENVKNVQHGLRQLERGDVPNDGFMGALKEMSEQRYRAMNDARSVLDDERSPVDRGVREQNLANAVKSLSHIDDMRAHAYEIIDTKRRDADEELPEIDVNDEPTVKLPHDAAV